ncbi:protein kinase [Pyxidicoccus fallax]|uniref:non-specific serine/threonine protein kinase n=1 Tax=Pyxidicoccus fallax TaxID=394095 RepID=A0A848LPW2_9BACT|nr:serine/threonine-protein kinase [Pyxidicoccus fallax]NMO19690.1 protein kinase [Pyxidicoccus fallax]NPC80135.1 protein kinase [Pyxidicoccus fallax]
MAHATGLSVCPPEAARSVVAPSPYGDDDEDATFKSKPKKEPRQVARPLVPSAPEVSEDDGGNEWEKSVARDVLVGKQLGDYVVKRRIGAGGMGIVYEGEHPVIGRKVAIKILRPDFAEGSRARDLVAEARAAAAIRHRGIIDIFGFGTIPHLGQYLVMEYLDGAPLDEVISQRAPMLEVEVVTILDELLGALAAAHAAGVIHRDLKPGNVFVVRDGAGNEYVKVLDFGLAKRSEAPNGTTPQTRASMMVGTPEYMAPEQACGQQVGPHTDLYAVGVIAFEMLTRRLPFEGATPMAIAVHHVHTPPPAPSEFVELHPDLETLVMQLLAKAPEDRPESAEAVRRELKLIAKQLSSDATQVSAPPRVSAPSTISQEAVAVPAPAPRQRTERYGQPGRRPAQPRRATPLPLESSPSAALRADPTAPDLSALPSTRSRSAVTVAVGAVVGLALVAAGGVLMSKGSEDSVPQTPRPLTAGAVASSTRLPLPATPVESGVKLGESNLEGPGATAPTVIASPPLDARTVESPSVNGGTPVLAATVLAKDTQAADPRETGDRRITRRPARPTSGTREGRGTTARTEESAPEVRTGTLRLKVKGYFTDVLVDGVSHGKKFQLELPAGLHKIEVRGNAAFTRPYSGPVTILAGELTEHHVELEPLQ